MYANADSTRRGLHPYSRQTAGAQTMAGLRKYTNAGNIIKCHHAISNAITYPGVCSIDTKTVRRIFFFPASGVHKLYREAKQKKKRSSYRGYAYVRSRSRKCGSVDAVSAPLSECIPDCTAGSERAQERNREMMRTKYV